eukprot:m.137030 g.137030  ORF g.137030 m.137030 type:complete len:221 (-) comp52487_c0_seq1:107-769(-)
MQSLAPSTSQPMYCAKRLMSISCLPSEPLQQSNARTISTAKARRTETAGLKLSRLLRNDSMRSLMLLERRCFRSPSARISRTQALLRMCFHFFDFKLTGRLLCRTIDLNLDLNGNFLEGAQQSGSLFRQAANGSWDKLYFVLKSDVLYYFSHAHARCALGAVSLPGVSVRPAPDTGKPRSFVLSQVKARAFILSAESDGLYTEWLEALRIAASKGIDVMY